MKSLLILSLVLLSAVAAAAGWRYRVYENGALVYEGSSPPVDLSYPPPGEPTPFASTDSPLRGTLLSPQAPARPHVIVIPPTAAPSRLNAPPAEDTAPTGN